VSPNIPVRLLLSFLALSAALTVAASTGMNASAAGTPKKLHPPTALWKAYPLVQTSRSGVRKGGVLGRRAASPQTVADGSRFPTVLLVTGVLMALLASTVLVRSRRANPARAGAHGRARRQTETPRGHAPRVLPPPPKRREEVAGRPEPEPPDELLEAQPPEVEPVEEQHTPEVRIGPTGDEGTRADGGRVHVPPRRLDVPPSQHCEIKLWRGYTRCQLFVALPGSADALALSPLFRLRKKAAPGDDALRALSSLLVELEGSGWSVASTGPAWYDRRLERSTRPE
jgi:hypothetical protein